MEKQTKAEVDTLKSLNLSNKKLKKEYISAKPVELFDYWKTERNHTNAKECEIRRSLLYTKKRKNNFSK